MASSGVVLELIWSAPTASGTRNALVLGALLVLVAFLAVLAVIRMLWGLIAELLVGLWTVVKTAVVLGLVLVALMYVILAPSTSSASVLPPDPVPPVSAPRVDGDVGKLLAGSKIPSPRGG